MSTDLGRLSVEQLQRHYAELAPLVQRLEGFAGAVLAELNARGGGRVPTDDGRSRSLAGWAADASRDSASAAGRRVQLATLLREGLPRVAAAVLSGDVGLAQGQVLTRLVGRVDAPSLAEAEPALITTAQLMDPVQLAAYVRHQIATWVEPVLDEDERRARDRRYLRTRRQEDGSLWGSFLLPAGDAESLLTALEPLARREHLADPRSSAQRRADALVDLVEQVLRHGQLPDSGGQRPQLTYVLPADWAARQVEERGCGECRRCPRHRAGRFAELVAAGLPGHRTGMAAAAGAGSRGSTTADGVSDSISGGSAAAGEAGPVPASHACAVAAWTGPQTRTRIEALLCDARITRVLLDQPGQVRSLQSLGDSVTATQRRALAARDRGCAVRGCTRPPAMCDAHHLTHRADGGATTLDNLVLLCRRHHVLWHLGKIGQHHLHVPWSSAPGRPIIASHISTAAAGPAPPAAAPPTADSSPA